MVGVMIEFIAWMFMGIVSIYVFVFVISIGLTVLLGISELFNNYPRDSPASGPWIPPTDSYIPRDHPWLKFRR